MEWQQMLDTLVRPASLVAAPVAVMLLFLPARSVSGMEALAVFYLSMLTVTPLVWFGAHLWAGRSVRPALSLPESLALAMSGLVILSIPGVAFFGAQRPLQHAARDIGAQRALPADNPALEHRIQPVTAYTFAGAGLVYAQSLIGAPDSRLVRIEQRQGGQWPSTPTGSHPSYCTDGNDVHLLWSVQEPPPYQRIHWAQSNGAVVRSEPTGSRRVRSAAPIASARASPSGRWGQSGRCSRPWCSSRCPPAGHLCAPCWSALGVDWRQERPGLHR